MAEQKKNPYPRKNFAVVADYLEEIALILANERGLVPIDETENGYEDIDVDDQNVQQLTVPDDAVSASIFFEADPTATVKDIVVRFKENGADPATDSGQYYGHGDIFNPTGKNILDNLRFIGTEAGKTTKLRVQYYQTAQVVES